MDKELWFTNQDAMECLHRQERLDVWREKLRDVRQGSGSITIHAYALKSLLEEIYVCRDCLAMVK